MSDEEAVYVETSALMRALLEEDERLTQRILEAAERVTSELTFAEASRSLWRALRKGRITVVQQRAILQALRDFRAHCEVLQIDAAVLERVGQEFPVEFLGTLDALHLSSVLVYEEKVGPLTVLSVDNRLRENAVALGLDLHSLE